MTSNGKYSILLFVPIFIFGCDTGPMVSSDTEMSLDPLEPEVVYQKSLADLITHDTLILNPSGSVPLAAELQLETTQPVQVELEIESPYENEEHLIHRFKDINTSFVLPVLGLYASYNNILHIRLYDSGDQLLGGETRMIDTPELFTEPPTIDVIVNTGRKKPGMNLVGFYGRTSPSIPQLPFIFDQYGHIQWYADFQNHPTLNRLYYGNGVERLKNGNLYFVDGIRSRIVEMDMLGKVVNQWRLFGYSPHHHVLELPNGNLLVTVNRTGISTILDYVVEIDRNTGLIENVWDLRESLDSRRLILWTNPMDWFHGNGLAYDQENDAIIVSGRYQGTVKLTRNNELIWILAPHRGWKRAGDGTDLKTKLLQPLDANGDPITDLRVVSGYSDHSDFAWPWNQHSPKLTPQGTLFVFDNGYQKNYNQPGPIFSRAVEYRIDEEAMTVQQIWEYGRERGRATYAAGASDVDVHPDENTVVFMPGDIYDENGRSGKTIEVDYTTKDVVYEAILHKPYLGDQNIIFHRMERLSIYP